jgi:hypothetical protein
MVEIVVAIAVVGVTFGVIFQALSQGLSAIRRGDALNAAMQLCQNKMNELLIDDDVFEDGFLEGQWDENFRWRAQLETKEIEDLAVDKSRLTTQLLYIRLTTFYRFGDRERAVKLFTIKLVPKPALADRARNR